MQERRYSLRVSEKKGTRFVKVASCGPGRPVQAGEHSSPDLVSELRPAELRPAGAVPAWAGEGARPYVDRSTASSELEVASTGGSSTRAALGISCC